MRKLFALLLALTMVFALCACGNQGGTPAAGGNVGGNEEEENLLVGKWTATVDLMTILESSDEMDLDELGEELGDLILPDDIELEIVMEFTDDGEVEITVDGEDAIEEWLGQITDNRVDYLKDVLKENGSSAAEWEAENGMSLKEYVEQSLAESLDLDADDLNVSETGEYKLEGDKLYFDEDGDFEEYFVIDLSSKKLTFEDHSDDWGELAYLEGVTFKHK